MASVENLRCGEGGGLRVSFVCVQVGVRHEVGFLHVSFCSEAALRTAYLNSLELENNYY